MQPQRGVNNMWILLCTNCLDKKEAKVRRKMKWWKPSVNVTGCHHSSLGGCHNICTHSLSVNQIWYENTYCLWHKIFHLKKSAEARIWGKTWKLVQRYLTDPAPLATCSQVPPSSKTEQLNRHSRLPLEPNGCLQSNTVFLLNWGQP